MSNHRIEALRERIVLAVLDTIEDNDPVITIAVGDNHIRVDYGTNEQ